MFNLLLISTFFLFLHFFFNFLFVFEVLLACCLLVGGSNFFSVSCVASLYFCCYSITTLHLSLTAMHSLTYLYVCVCGHLTH